MNSAGCGSGLFHGLSHPACEGVAVRCTGGGEGNALCGGSHGADRSHACGNGEGDSIGGCSGSRSGIVSSTGSGVELEAEVRLTCTVCTGVVGGEVAVLIVPLQIDMAVLTGMGGGVQIVGIVGYVGRLNRNLGAGTVQTERCLFAIPVDGQGIRTVGKGVGAVIVCDNGPDNGLVRCRDHVIDRCDSSVVQVIAFQQVGCDCAAAACVVDDDLIAINRCLGEGIGTGLTGSIKLGIQGVQGSTTGGNRVETVSRMDDSGLGGGLCNSRIYPTDKAPTLSRRIVIGGQGHTGTLEGVERIGLTVLAESDGSRLTGVSLTVGGSGIVCRNNCTEELEDQLGIVNKDVTGTGDGLDSIITAQLPGVHRVFFHPLQKDVLTLHDTFRAPHTAGIAPTDVDIQHDTGNVAVQVVLAVGDIVGIVEAAALAVSLVAAATVLRGCRGAEHHDVVFGITFALGIGPGMLSVPGTVPGGTNLRTGVEGGNLTAAVLAVGVHAQILDITIAGNIGLLTGHKALQCLVQRAAGHGRSRGRAAQGHEILICAVCVECVCIDRRRCSGHAANTPVVHIGSSRGVDCQTGQEADAQSEDQHP